MTVQPGVVTFSLLIIQMYGQRANGAWYTTVLFLFCFCFFIFFCTLVILIAFLWRIS